MIFRGAIVENAVVNRRRCAASGLPSGRRDGYSQSLGPNFYAIAHNAAGAGAKCRRFPARADHGGSAGGWWTLQFSRCTRRIARFRAIYHSFRSAGHYSSALDASSRHGQWRTYFANTVRSGGSAWGGIDAQAASDWTKTVSDVAGPAPEMVWALRLSRHTQENEQGSAINQLRSNDKQHAGNQSLVRVGHFICSCMPLLDGCLDCFHFGFGFFAADVDAQSAEKTHVDVGNPNGGEEA